MSEPTYTHESLRRLADTNIFDEIAHDLLVKHADAWAAQVEGQCHWREERDGLWGEMYWGSECGSALVWKGRPSEHEQRYCGYCGKRLVEVPYIEHEEDEEEDNG